jgi:2,3-bisphosphoglycerate-independent phosphoglycerate mutase
MEPLFKSMPQQNVLGEVLSKNGKSQLRIAETEKYAHVTYFFNNGREEAFEGEERIIINSPRDVGNYDEKPEMSAEKIRDEVIAYMKEKNPDFICLNFANPDMVGHTGNFDATVKACEVIDNCTEKVVDKALENDYITIVLADHGNADYMKNDDGSPNTNHTTNPVPCILVHKDNGFQLKDGKLSDVAPSILKLMGLEIPEEMTGEVLLLEENKSRD